MATRPRIRVTHDRESDPAPTGDAPVKEVACASLPTDHGRFQIHVFESRIDDATHVALVCGDLGDGERVLARVHSSCVTGDIFHSSRCDCGEQLDMAMQRVAEEGRGVVLYLFQEGRGIGLANKIRAYALQEQGRDTVEANEQLGFDADLRDYASAVEIFRLLGVKSLRLMSNNPRKLEGVTGGELAIVERVPLEVKPSENNRRYLQTKKQKLGHKLSKV
jgi:3,4-dihydroxy 2-butanone 4-phosphate synthase/GTP cyclohydrolase II